MKKCSQCGDMKEDEDFINEKGKVRKLCKRCREYMKNYNERRKDKQREYMKEYYAEHKEEHSLRMQAWHISHRTERSEYKKMWNEKNPEYNTTWYKDHKTTESERQKKWRTSPAKYSTYANKLTVLESPTEGKENALLVRCAKCGVYFTPTNRQVQNRILSLTSEDGAERRLYCSDHCKHSCEVYRKIKDPAERATRFERDPTWAKEVKKRARYACERCGSKSNIEAHHEIAVKVDSTKASNLDNGICLCHHCHNLAHSESGCTLSDLRKI